MHILKHIYGPHSSRELVFTEQGDKSEILSACGQKKGEKNVKFEENFEGNYQETKSCSAKSSHWVNVNFRFCVFQFTSLSFQHLLYLCKIFITSLINHL